MQQAARELTQTSLDVLLATARRTGWATGLLSLDQVHQQARLAELVEVPNRTGEPPVKVLRATAVKDAHPHSLSALFGLGAQPLHTDGAHLAKPPALLVLHAAKAYRTPTLLWSHKRYEDDAATEPAAHLACLQAGVFVVRAGEVGTFLTSAYDDTGYRYDPGCMTPADDRARAAARYMQARIHEAHEHYWTQADQVLVIDNRHTLHARAALADGDDDRALTRVAYCSQEAS